MASPTSIGCCEDMLRSHWARVLHEVLIFILPLLASGLRSNCTTKEHFHLAAEHRAGWLWGGAGPLGMACAKGQFLPWQRGIRLYEKCSLWVFSLSIRNS